MPLPPLTNLFASAPADPQGRRDLEGALERSGKFDWVRAAPGGWLIAGAALPGGPEKTQPTHRDDVVFAEGFDRLSKKQVDRAATLMARSPERLAEIPGDFALAYFSLDGRAVVARSCGGQVPIYTWSDRSSAGFSTLLSDVAEFRADEPDLDPLAMATWLGWFTGFPHGRTFLSNVSALDRGHCAVIRSQPAGETARAVKYWFPVPESLPPRAGRVTEDVAQRFRRQVLGSLERETSAKSGNLLTLSGGVDSSALAALIRGALDRPLATLSLVPSTEAGRARELFYIDRIVEGFQAYPSFRFPINGESRRALLSSAPRVAHQPLHPALGALPEIKKRFPVTVLVGGEYADEICGAQWHFPDWARDASWTRLRHWREYPYGFKDAGRWLKRRIEDRRRRPQLPYVNDLPALVAPNVREEYRAWIRGMRARVADDSSPYRTLAGYMNRESAMGMNWEVTSALGVRRVWPFVSRDTIELSYSIHPDDLIGPGTKRLLRRAFHEDVPACSLYRSDKGGWATELASGTMLWHEALPSELAGIVRDDWFPHPPAVIPAESGLRLLQLVTAVTAVREFRARRTLHLR